jgi:Mor family transcriptional regulator
MTVQIAQLQNLLPDSIHEVAAAIGMPATLRLVERFGGTTLQMRMGANRLGRAALDALSQQIGHDETQKLALLAGGEPLYIPRCHVAVRRLRDLAICSAFEASVRSGTTANFAVTELALKYKLTDRWVWRILKETPIHVEPPTPDLFH